MKEIMHVLRCNLSLHTDVLVYVDACLTSKQISFSDTTALERNNFCIYAALAFDLAS